MLNATPPFLTQHTKEEVMCQLDKYNI